MKNDGDACFGHACMPFWQQLQFTTNSCIFLFFSRWGGGGTPPPPAVLLQEMATPGREVRWEHVPAHVNVQGNEVANGLAMEGMCSSPLWSQHVAPHSSSGSESTVGLRGGSGSESEDTKALGSSLGMVPMDSDELSAQISATTKRGCRPWAGPPWGPGNRGAGLLLPPPPQQKWGRKQAQHSPPPPACPRTPAPSLQAVTW